MSVANVYNHSSGLGASHPDYANGARQWSRWKDAATDTAVLTGTLFVLSFIALGVSGYLASVSLTSGSVAGCGAGSVFDCDHVLHSRWSTVLSVPVSLLAVMTHTILLTSLLARPSTQRWRRIRWSAISFAALSAGAAAVWFIGLQVFWLQHLCAYCLVAHGCGLAAAGLILWARPLEGVWLKRTVGASLTALAALVSTQVVSEPPPTYSVVQPPMPATEEVGEQELFFDAPAMSSGSSPSPENQTARFYSQGLSLAMAVVSPSSLFHLQVAAGGGGTDAPAGSTAASTSEPMVKVLNGIKLNPSHWPIVGNPDADMIFVELFDYTCPHCQKTHHAIEGARKKYGDRLAVVVLPVPLNRQCNPSATSTHAMHREACDLARLAIAVWTVDRDAFAEFHHYLFDSNPDFAAAKAKAMQMVDGQRLTEAMNGSLPSEYIAKHVALYQKAGAGTIPKMLFPAATIEGEVASAEALSQLIERHLASSR